MHEKFRFPYMLYKTSKEKFRDAWHSLKITVQESIDIMYHALFRAAKETKRPNDSLFFTA